MKLLIGRYIKPYFPRMGVGFVIKFIGTVMDLCIPYILAHIIDTVIPLRRGNLIFLWGLLMVLCSVLAVSFNIIANRMASWVARCATENIRHDLFRRIMYLSNRQTDAFTKPSLISRMTTDTYNMHHFIGMMQRLGVRAPILLVGGVCVTFTLDPAMAAVLLGVMPLLTLVIVLVSRKSIPLYGKLQEAIDRFVRMVREDIAGIRVIKSLSKTDYETEKFRQINREVVRREKGTGMLMAVINPSMNILLNLGLVAVILVGAWRVNAGTSEVGKILAFTTYFTIILNAVMSVSRMFEMMSKAISSAGRIRQVLESGEDMPRLEMGEDVPREQGGDVNRTEAEEDVPRALAEASKPCQDQILFDHVSFSYRGDDKYVLEDICFSLKKGETLGIIGEIGSGKSTLISLLMRFYDATGGRILLEGRDVRSYEAGELREKFGVVFQNDTIFEDTIMGNVTLGREMTRDQITQALTYAQAMDFVEKKGEQEEEALNIRGANLSGGQKQRVLIARALAKKPEILILDDSTSALDYRTDAALRKGIRSYMADTTLIIVAQRISSIRNADRILVLEGGRVIGCGTHQELMRDCPVYGEIARSQTGETAPGDFAGSGEPGRAQAQAKDPGAAPGSVGKEAVGNA